MSYSWAIFLFPLSLISTISICHFTPQNISHDYALPNASNNHLYGSATLGSLDWHSVHHVLKTMLKFALTAFVISWTKKTGLVKNNLQSVVDILGAIVKTKVSLMHKLSQKKLRKNFKKSFPRIIASLFNFRFAFEFTPVLIIYDSNQRFQFRRFLWQIKHWEYIFNATLFMINIWLTNKVEKPNISFAEDECGLSRQNWSFFSGHDNDLFQGHVNPTC